MPNHCSAVGSKNPWISVRISVISLLPVEKSSPADFESVVFYFECTVVSPKIASLTGILAGELALYYCEKKRFVQKNYHEANIIGKLQKFHIVNAHTSINPVRVENIPLISQKRTSQLCAKLNDTRVQKLLCSICQHN